MTPEEEKQWREEAERLKALDASTQRQIVALHRERAADKRLSNEDRRVARERADALERFLNLKPKRRTR